MAESVSAAVSGRPLLPAERVSVADPPPCGSDRTISCRWRAIFLAAHGGGAGRAGMVLSSAAEGLRAHRWPGNVRELGRTWIQRAMIMAPGDVVEAEHLHLQHAVFRRSASWLQRGDCFHVRSIRTRRMPPVPTVSAIWSASISSRRWLWLAARALAIERLGILERTLRYKLKQYKDEGFSRGDR